MSYTSQSGLLTLFADGQAAGAIVPGDVRDLVVSAGPISHNAQQGPVYSLGNQASSVTLTYANGSIQALTMTAGTLTINAANAALPNFGSQNAWAAFDLFVTNNSSGNGVITWGTNITFNGTSPQPAAGAASLTKFRLESINNGASWLIVAVR